MSTMTTTRRATKGTNYRPGMTGWVIRCEHTLPLGTSVVWWYGPRSGWGTTYGPLDYSVNVWKLRRQAVEAMRSMYGQMPDGASPQTVENAEREQGRRRARVWVDG